jgi:hypothetical protein
MSKRARDANDLDPYKTQHLACLTFLWIRSIDTDIRKCVDKNIAKKICYMINVVLTGSMIMANEDQVKLVCYSEPALIWFWRDDLRVNHRPCMGCLRPIISRKNRYCNPLVCYHCQASKGEEHTGCCGQWVHSISAQCFDKFRNRFDLPKE